MLRSITIRSITSFLFLTQVLSPIVFGQNISNTTINTCLTTIYDDGGPTGNYTETNYEMTICASSGTELYVIVESLLLGTAFNGDSDILIIYEGTGTGGTVLFDSQINPAPSSILLSNDACITITLDTDPAFFSTDVGAGFEILISCTLPETCSDGILNNGEVMIDCGGPNCSPCYQMTSCSPNVVNNGDFESSTAVCPSPAGGIYGSSNQIPRPWFDQTPVTDWYGTAIRIDDNISYPSPDYFNSSCTNAAAINCMTGSGSLGMFVHFGGGQSAEYIQQQLAEPLVSGEEYCISVRTSTMRGGNSGGPATDKLGFWFHNNTYSNGTGFLEWNNDNGGSPFLGAGTTVNAIPQVVNPPGQMITDNCQNFNYSFCPTGGETHLVVGNFTPGSSASGSSEYISIDDLVIVKSCPLSFDSQLTSSGTPDCAGSCVDLEVSVANQTGGCEITNDFTYQWFENGTIIPGETTTTLASVCPTTNVTYSVEITYNAGCKTYTKPENETSISFNCSSFIVDVVALPNTICEGDCSDLTATPDVAGSYTYSWTELGNATVIGATQNLNVCPIATTTYTVSVSDGTETVTENVTITVNSSDASLFDAVADICEGSTLNPLPTTSTNGYAGSWNPTLDNTTTTTYTFTPDAGQCASSGTLTIVVNPSYNLTETISTCNGQTVTYPDGTSETITVSGTHTSNLQTTNACDSIIVTTVTMNPGPTFALASTDPTSCTATDGTIIIGGLNANSNYIVSYNGLGQVNMTTDANGDLIISGLATGSYFDFYVEDQNGCSTLDTSILNLAPADAPVIDELLKIDLSCNGILDGQIQINASGGTGSLSYEIDNGQGFTDNNTTGIFSNLDAGTYSITVTDGVGCQSTDFIVINEPGAITQQFTSTDILCFGDANGIIDWINVNGGTPPYQYSIDNGNSYSGNTTFTNLGNGIYFVTVQDQNGCNSDTSQVTIFEPNQLLLTTSDIPTTNPNCVGGISTCNGTITINIPAGSGTAPYSYQWPSGIASPSNNMADNLCGGQYSIAVEDANGCSSSLQVVLIEPISPIIDEISLLDAGCNNQCNGEVSIAATNGTIFTLNGLTQSTGDFEGICAGDYNILVSNAENCSVSEQITIGASENPYASFLFDPPYGTIDQTEITFDNLSEFADSYYWTITGLDDNAGYFYATTDEYFSHIFPEDPGKYQVCLEANGAEGCKDSICNIVEIRDNFVIYVPNAFTPDGDAHNQTFKPVISGFDVTQFEMIILNRWGELVFETHNSDVGWDGTFQGKMVQDGVYVWKINLKLRYTDEKRSFYGHVTILR